MTADACWCCGAPLDLEGECPEGCCQDGCSECSDDLLCCTCQEVAAGEIEGEEDELVEEDEDA